MDPGYVRDKPGKAPCGMDMVPVYEDVGGEAPGTIRYQAPPSSPWECENGQGGSPSPVRLTLAVGLVNFNRRNLSTVTTKVNGWLERLYVNATGDPVRKGQALVSVCSPEFGLKPGRIPPGRA